MLLQVRQKGVEVKSISLRHVPVGTVVMIRDGKQGVIGIVVVSNRYKPDGVGVFVLARKPGGESYVIDDFVLDRTPDGDLYVIEEFDSSLEAAVLESVLTWEYMLKGKS